MINKRFVCLSTSLSSAPPTALLPKARYERIIEAFGGKGFFAETPDELKKALESAFVETGKNKKPVLINVMISPYADRKPQVKKSENAQIEHPCGFGNVENLPSSSFTIGVNFNHS